MREKEIDKIIIGFTGFARSGKTYTANVFKDVLNSMGIKSDIFPIATSIKQNCKLPPDASKEEYRKTYIEYGNKMKYLYGKDYFIKEICNVINHSDVRVGLLDDLRFLIEYQYIQKNYKNWYIYHIKTPLVVIKDRMGIDAFNTYMNTNFMDISEQEHLYIETFQILGTYSKETLYEIVKKEILKKFAQK